MAYVSIAMKISIMDTSVHLGDTLYLGLSPNPPNDHNSTLAQINFHSLSSQLALETLCLLGYIDVHPVVILVDEGSTHNFIQEPLAQLLGLSTRATTPLRVMVGNNQHLDCHQLCEAVCISTQDMSFPVDLHLLSLSGANVVLGVQWFKALDPILTDYNALSMKFFHNGHLIELKGDAASTFHLLSPPQFRPLLRKDGASAYFHIAITPTMLPSKPKHLPLAASRNSTFHHQIHLYISPSPILASLTTHKPPHPPST